MWMGSLIKDELMVAPMRSRMWILRTPLSDFIFARLHVFRDLHWRTVAEQLSCRSVQTLPTHCLASMQHGFKRSQDCVSISGQAIMGDALEPDPIDAM